MRYASASIAHPLLNMPCKPAPDTGGDNAEKQDKVSKLA
jgi:hypothetical protein